MRKVLVVEDYQDGGNMLSLLLEQCGSSTRLHLTESSRFGRVDELWEFVHVDWFEVMSVDAHAGQAHIQQHRV